MKKHGMVLLCGMFGLLAAAVNAADLAGAWHAESESPRALQEYPFAFQSEGEKLTGKAVTEVNGQKRESQLKELVIDGDTVTFVELLSLRGSERRIRYTGNIGANDIAFTREVGGVAKTEFKVARGEATSSKTGEAKVPATGAGNQPRRGGGFGGPIALNPDDKPAFDDPPAGIDKQREGIPHGKLEIIEYDSRTVGTKRKMQVYTPPEYTTDEKYPVLYLLHGIGGDETEWQRFAHPNILLDNLIADGKARPMIIVMPNGRAQKNDRADAGMGAAPAFATFERDLLDDVIPTIQSRYSTLTNGENRALAGLSMGGGQSLNFGLGHLDTFAWVGGFSSAPNTKPPAQLVPDPEAARQKLRLMYLSCGDKDGLFRISQGVHAHLREKQVSHIWHVDGNGHDATHWRNSLWHFSQRIFKSTPQQ